MKRCLFAVEKIIAERYTFLLKWGQRGMVCFRSLLIHVKKHRISGAFCCDTGL